MFSEKLKTMRVAMKKMKKLFFVSTLAYLLSACGGGQNNQEYNDDLPVLPIKNTIAADNNKNKNLSAASSFPFDYHQNLSASDAIRPTVITADLDFETENVRQAVTAISGITQRYQGFVAFSEINTLSGNGQRYQQSDGNILKITHYTHQANMVLRIPRAQVDGFLKEVQKHIVFLDQQVFKAEDVVLDLRRQALEADRQKQLAINLDEANNHRNVVAASAASDAAATKIQTEGLLALPNHLFNEKEQADYAHIQQEYWQDKINYATIHMQFRQPEAVLKQSYPNPQSIDEQHKMGFESMLTPMLKRGWSGFLSVILFFIGIWPLALGVPLLWLAWKRWQSGKEKEELPVIIEEEKPIPYPFDDDDDDDHI